MDTLYKRAKEMVMYVKGHEVIAAIYLTRQSEKNKSTTLKLPSLTRWAGVVIMFESLLGGNESLQEMAISQSPDMDSHPCLGTHKARNRLTNTMVEELVAIRANVSLCEPDNEPSSTRLESDSEDGASESDVQEVDFEEVQGEDKPERKTTKAFVSRLSFYRCMLKMFLGDTMAH
jgi:hypothetical protein